jgi:two-component system nitrogen regulation response regulator GlnG
MARLLLIDDDPVMILDQLTHALSPQGMWIDVAHTAEEGLLKVAAQPPDIILLDVHLPDLSGLETYQRVRQVDARIPVIFITWAATADTAIEAMKEGAFDYLFKPLDLARLRGVVVQALELGRLMREPAVVAQAPPRRGAATPSSAAAPPWARSTRPSAASPPRTSSS